MHTYIALLRGINVGGKNKVSMAELKRNLEEMGYADVRTYINSGNVLLTSNKTESEVTSDFESNLPKWFKLDSDILKVLVINDDTLNSVVHDKPSGFGNDPSKYYSDVIFLINIPTDQAYEIFTPKEGVDRIWKGEGVIYSERLGAERTKSRLSKIMASPLYKSMTIRSWNTTVKLYEMVRDSRAA